MQKYEDEILEWEPTRTVHLDSAVETDSDLVQEPAGQKLVEVLKKILVEDEATEYLRLGLAETGEIQRQKAIPGLKLPHFCWHKGPPEESRPCAVQADVAIRQANRAWEADPERLRSLCDEVTEVVDRSVWDKALAAGGDGWMQRTLEVASELPSDLDLTDEEEEEDSPTVQAEEGILPSAPPMEMTRSLKR
jgi:hypothetical protein